MTRTLVVFGAQDSAGALAARQYGNEGYEVVLVASNEKCVRALIAVLESEGIATRVFAGDLTRPAAAREIIRSIGSEVGSIDVLYYSPNPANDPGYLPALSWEDAPDSSRPPDFCMAIVVSEVLLSMRLRRSGSIFLGRHGLDITNVLATYELPQCADSLYCQHCSEEQLAREGIHISTLCIESLFCSHSRTCTSNPVWN